MKQCYFFILLCISSILSACDDASPQQHNTAYNMHSIQLQATDIEKLAPIIKQLYDAVPNKDNNWNSSTPMHIIRATLSYIGINTFNPIEIQAASTFNSCYQLASQITRLPHDEKEQLLTKIQREIHALEHTFYNAAPEDIAHFGKKINLSQLQKLSDQLNNKDI